MKTSSVALLPLLLSALAVGCAGPPIPAPIDGEPVCGDFQFGVTRTRMVGSLRYPVRLRILAGKDVVMKTVLRGKRTNEEPPARSFIPDDNAEYTVEWAQCENERAPTPASEDQSKPGTLKPPQAEVTSYECGEAAVYKTEKLATKKRDVASHHLTFAPPPKSECWLSDAEPQKAAAPGAGAAPAPAEAPGEANAAGDDAGALSTDSGAPAADAGATGDAKGDKGKDAKSDKGKDEKSRESKDAKSDKREDEKSRTSKDAKSDKREDEKSRTSKDAKSDKGKEPPKK